MKILFYLFLSLSSVPVFSQNLLIDGSFENCSELFDCDWIKICESPDLISENISKLKDKSKAKRGNKAYSGKHYLGMYLGYESEFLIGTLKENLKKDTSYDITMQVCQSRSNSLCEESFKSISIWFLDSIPQYPETEWGLSLNSKFIPLKGRKHLINEMNTWELIRGKYTAQGNEKYFIIGNFKGANLDITRSCEALYYYFDDIKVIPSQVDSEKLAINKPIEIKDIFFESGKAELLPESFSALDNLAWELKQLQNVRIEISGHTDNVGNAEKNKELSRERAKAVYNYLISRSIDKSMLSYSGKGETKPIAQNTSESGRSKNRRVEFKLIPI